MKKEETLDEKMLEEEEKQSTVEIYKLIHD